MQAHLFCSPQFIVQIDRDATAGGDSADCNAHVLEPATSSSSDGPSRGTSCILPSVLLAFQSEIYEVLSTALRYKIHSSYAPITTSSSSSGNQGGPSSSIPPYRSLLADKTHLFSSMRRVARGEGLSVATHQPPPPPSGLVFLSQTATMAACSSLDEGNTEAGAPSRTRTIPTPLELSYVAHGVWSARGEGEVDSSSSGAAYTPSQLNFIQTDHFSKHCYRLLWVTDSRVAAELTLLLLSERGGVSLPHSCSLHLCYHAAARSGLPEHLPHRLAAAAVPSELLRSRRLTMKRGNLDEDLHSALVTGFGTERTKAILKELLQRPPDAASSSSSATFNLATTSPGSTVASSAAALSRRRHLEVAIQYITENVTYAAVMDEQEEASPLLLSLGLLLPSLLPPVERAALPGWSDVTVEEVLQGLLRHPRRMVQAVGLYITRYLLPPEEWPLCFLYALGEPGAISVSYSGTEVRAVRELAQQLLTQNEVDEAWLPTVAALYQEVVRQWMDTWRLYWEEEGKQQQSAEPLSTSPSKKHGGGEVAAQPAHTRDTPLSRLGFHSIADLVRHTDQLRRPQPRRLATLFASRQLLPHERAEAPFQRRRTGGDQVLEEDADVDEDEGENSGDELRLDVVEDVGNGAGTSRAAAGTSLASLPASRKRERPAERQPPRGGAAQRTAAGGNKLHPSWESSGVSDSALSSIHRTVQDEGYRLLLSLLGRSAPFDANDEHLIVF